MKSKKFQKKLTLNKKTIADLKIGQMEGIHGGINKPPVSILYIGCGVGGTNSGNPCEDC